MTRGGVFLVLFHSLAFLVLTTLGGLAVEYGAPLWASVFFAGSLLPLLAIRAEYRDAAADDERRATTSPALPNLGLIGGPIPRTAAKGAAVLARTECDSWWASLGIEHDPDCLQAPRRVPPAEPGHR